MIAKSSARFYKNSALARWSVCFLLFVGASSAGFAEQPISGIATVIDGDTIEIHGTRIRLHGIDAPESRQECRRLDGTPWRCGQQAALALGGRIGHATVQCDGRSQDRYRRLIAVCYLGNDDLNRWMVASGWAVAYRIYSMDYVADEKRAHDARLRIWSGTFEMPWEWRASKKE